MSQLAPAPVLSRAQELPKPGFDPPGVAAHGIGRGEYAALVFSGSRAALGDVAGFYTWSTPRKFVFSDTRLDEADDFAAIAASPLPPWPGDRLRPTAGVCFVLSDEDHPAAAALRDAGGVEFEHFVVLTRLTQSSLAERRLESFLSQLKRGCPIALLGYGDQGERIGRLLIERRGSVGPLLVVEADPPRRERAERAGFRPVDAGDPLFASAAIICSPLARPRVFAKQVELAHASGLAVYDNALPWHGGAEFIARGALRLTVGVERACRTDGWRVTAQDHGLDIELLTVRDERRRLGTATLPHLSSAGRIRPGPAGSWCDLSNPPTRTTEYAATEYVSTSRVFAGLAGQSNQHDAAVAIFAAREFLAEFLPGPIAELMPAEHRTALGGTPFERALFGTTTNRSLGAPYMSVCEQTALGVLAGAFAPDAPIIEIGSALGGSTVLMAAATCARRPEIYSIDPDAPTRHLMHAMFEAEGHADRLRQIVKPSDAALADLRHLTGRAGLVFVDGLHLESVAASDFAGYAPLVRSGGCIAFHDVGARYAGVFRVVAERVVADRRFRPLFMADTLAAFERVAD